MTDKLLAILFFTMLLLTGRVEEDPEVQTMTHQMRMEDLAKMYATTIVACANGGSFSVGDVLVFCDPYTIGVTGD